MSDVPQSQPPSPPPAPILGPDGLPVGMRLNDAWEVTPRAVRDWMRLPATDRPLLLDCRREDEWARCRIDGAVLIPMDQIEQRLDEIEEDDQGRGRRRPVIVYCHHGRRSLQVTGTLRGHGFTDVKSMAGGIDLWSLDIDPSVPRY